MRGSGLANRCPTVESNGTEVPVQCHGSDGQTMSNDVKRCQKELVFFCLCIFLLYFDLFVLMTLVYLLFITLVCFVVFNCLLLAFYLRLAVSTCF